MAMNKNYLKGAAIAALACVLPAAADNPTDVRIPLYDEISVAPGAMQTVSGTVSLDPSTRMRKTGGGTLQMSTSAIEGRNTVGIRVDEGTFVRTDSATDPVATVLSDAIMGKLAVWLSVKDPDPSHISTRTIDGDETSYVEYWYDVRETNTNSPSYIYAKTTHMVTNIGPVRKTGRLVRQYSTVTNSMEGLYFGGYKSGVSMDFMTPGGSAFNIGPRECSAVHGIINSWGYLFGNSHTSSGNPYLESDNGSRTTSFGYGWQHCWGPVMGDARIWVDGVEYDRAKPVKRGFQLLHQTVNSISSSSFSSIAQALYSWSSSSTGNANSWRKGGDYVSEVMYFTNRLTAAERRDVQNYLMRKWFGRSIPETDVEIGQDATVEVSAGTGETFFHDSVAHGIGSYVKTGAGELVHRPDSGRTDNLAELAIEEGAVCTPRLQPIKTCDGDLVTAARTDGLTNTVRVTRTAGVYNNKIVKAGDSALAINSVPAATRKLDVQNGTLVLRPQSKDVKRRYEVPITNNSFETWNAADAATGNIKVKTSYCGWQSTGDVYFYHFDRWTELGKEGGPLSATIGAYGFNTQRPPAGDCAMVMIATNASAFTSVTIPEDGEYELSFMFWGRGKYTYLGFLDVTMRDADSGETAGTFGSVSFVQNSRWTQQNMRASLRAGTYNLHLQDCWAGYPPDSGKVFVTLLVDDIHLFRVGDYKASYKIPGGDFEEIGGVKYVNGNVSLPTTMSTQYTVKGWAFSTNYYMSYPEVAPVNSQMLGEAGRHNGNCYNGGRRPYGGEYQLLFRHAGAKATTTFTPPTGRWYLKCHTGLWSNYDNPRLKATVAMGATTNELGEISVDKLYKPQPNVWATPFTADGTTEATLTLTYLDSASQYHGINADDFELVAEYENDRDFIRNGDMELPWDVNGTVSYRTSWTTVDGKDFGGSGGLVSREYGRDDIGHFGPDHGSGDYYIEFYYQGGVRQDVTLPHAGWYRLSFLMKSRIYSGNPSCQKVPVELIDMATSTTNRITYVDGVSKGVYEQRSCVFHVDSAGTYRLLFRGTAGGTYALLDDVSLKFVGVDGTGATSMPGADKLDINIAAGARLQLDFSGTNTIHHFKSAGLTYGGVVDKNNCPEIDGAGALLAIPYGTMLMIR